MKTTIILFISLIALSFQSCYSGTYVASTSDSITYKVYRGKWLNSPINAKAGDVTPVYIPLDIDTVFKQGDELHINSEGFYYPPSIYTIIIEDYRKTLKLPKEQ